MTLPPFQYHDAEDEPTCPVLPETVRFAFPKADSHGGEGDDLLILRSLPSFYGLHSLSVL